MRMECTAWLFVGPQQWRPHAPPPPPIASLPNAGVVLLTEPGTRLPDGDGVRLLIAFPNANSGAVAYFNATQVWVQRCTKNQVQLGMVGDMGERCAAQVALQCGHLQHTLDGSHVANTASVAS